MSLESCPKCGYALSVTDHECRHCSGLERGFSILTRSGAPKVYVVFAAVVALSFAVWWMCVR